MITSSESNFSGKSGLRGLTFYTGLGLYLLSFFLPVFRDTLGSKSISGWRCAYAALFLWVIDLGPNTMPWLNFGYRLAGFGGLINPIAIVYALLHILDRGGTVRRVLATALLICIALTWFSLAILCAEDALCPYVGHAVWIAGLLLMISDTIREFITPHIQRIKSRRCS